MEGTVKKKVEDRGFGFIVGDDGKDYFFHLSSVKQPTWETLQVKDRVRFNPGMGPRGPRAEDIHLAE